MPFVGSILALFFYEFVYVKTQELLDDDQGSDVSGEATGSGLGNLQGEIEPDEDSSDKKKDEETV